MHEKFLATDLPYVLRQATLISRKCKIVFPSTHSPNQEILNHGLEIDNAILESALSFFRKANEFFGNANKTRARACDILPSWEEDWILNKEEVEWFNSRVMHISYEEAKMGKENWDQFLTDHLPPMYRIASKFFEQLKEEKDVPEEIKNAFQDCLESFPESCRRSGVAD